MRRRQRAREAAPIRGYEKLSVGALRERLRRKSPEELRLLLRHEQATKKRRSAIDLIRRELERRRGPARAAAKKRSRAAPLARRVPERYATVEQVIETELARRVGPEARPFAREALLEKLSELLQVEKDGLALYDLGLEKFRHREDVLDRLTQLRDQSAKHVRILRELIAELGGDPDYVSHFARIAHECVRPFFETDRPGPAGEARYLENVVLAETRDRANWTWLRAIAERIDDERLARRLSEVAEEIEREEAQHVSWAQAQATVAAVEAFFEQAAGAQRPVGAAEIEAASPIVDYTETTRIVIETDDDGDEEE